MNRIHLRGYSLLELLTALTIVAILASVSVPSYQGYVARARRADAVAGLVRLQLAQQRWRMQHAAYAADVEQLSGPGAYSPEGYYRLQIEQAAAGDFLALAVPLGVQAGDACGVFAVDAKGPVLREPYADHRCWNR